MGNQVKFVETTQTAYDTLETREPGALYFTTDTKRLYRGDELYASELTPVYEGGTKFSDWTVTRDEEDVTTSVVFVPRWNSTSEKWDVGLVEADEASGSIQVTADEDETSLAWEVTGYQYVAVREANKFLGYAIAGQTDKPLVSQEVLEDLKDEVAPLDSPALTGTPTTPDVESNSNEAQIANKKYVDEQVAAAAGRMTRIYNSAVEPTDALDDKCQLYMSTLQDSILVNETTGQQTPFNKRDDWEGGIVTYMYYNGNGGPIYVYCPSDGTLRTGNYQGTILAQGTPGLDPRNVGVNLNLQQVEGQDTWGFIPKGIRINPTPYGHFALETIPDREYSSSSKYNLGDLVKYRANTSVPYKAYRCKQTIKTAENWTASHWDEIPVLVDKADKVSNATNGNLAALDSNGNPKDSSIPSVNIEFNDGNQSMRIGMSSQITSGKVRQLALGDYSTTGADGAIAIGVRKYSSDNPTQATAKDSMAIGQGARAIAEGATQIGFSSTPNNKSNSLRFMDTEIVNSDGKVSAAVLTPVYSDTPTFSEWTVKRDGVDVTSQVTQPSWNESEGKWLVGESHIAEDSESDSSKPGTINSTSLSWEAILGEPVVYTATRVRTDFLGYQLGDQDSKLLASQDEVVALRNRVSELETLLGNIETALQQINNGGQS